MHVSQCLSLPGFWTQENLGGEAGKGDELAKRETSSGLSKQQKTDTLLLSGSPSLPKIPWKLTGPGVITGSITCAPLALGNQMT